MDCVVKSWIVATLTDDLAKIISAQGSTARHAWLAVESQFLDNREARSIHLETRFRNFVQGNLSATDYCRRLKKMADDLTALGEVITNRTLVLNVIRGLNERFSHVGALLRRSRPYVAAGPSPPSWRLMMTSSSRNSHWRTRSPLPLLSLPPPQQQAPPALPHPRPTWAPGALAALSPPTAIAAASAAAVERGALVATTALEATALPLAPSSSRRPAPSSLPPVVAPGPVSTTHGWVPFRCGQGVLVLRWHPSRCLLIYRHSSRPSSPSNNRHSSPTSSLLPSLPPMSQDSGSPRGTTILWPASLIGTRRPSPPPSARHC